MSKTQEKCLKAVIKEPCLLQEIPDRLKIVEEVVEVEVLEEEPSLLNFVPDQLKIQEMCVEAVKQRVMVIGMCP